MVAGARLRLHARRRRPMHVLAGLRLLRGATQPVPRVACHARRCFSTQGTAGKGLQGSASPSAPWAGAPAAAAENNCFCGGAAGGAASGACFWGAAAPL